MTKYIFTLSFIVIGLTLSGCGTSLNTLTISDAEKAGFERDKQKIFQIVQARDGWSGNWAGDRVELYQYESESAVKLDYFETSVQEGNFSGWNELCSYKNLVMLSKGKNACRYIETVENEY